MSNRNIRRMAAALLCALLVFAPFAEAHAATIEYTVTATKVNVRKSASTDSKVAGVVRQGETLTLLEMTDSGWLKVSSSVGTGFVSPDYVCLTALSGEGAQAVVLAEKLNVRSAASAGSKVLSVPRRGAVLSVLGLTDGWLKVTYDGKTGYVSPEYVRLQPGQQDAVPTQAPSPTQAPASALLKKGSRGEAVLTLQNKLIRLGYLTGPADGIYGSDTVAAVRAFQRDYGLTADGDAGASTQAALENAVATPVPTAAPTPAPTAIPTPVPTQSAAAPLKKGSRGAAVEALQEKLIALGYLTGKADGKFGNDTVAAVRAFQRDYGLTDDGDAGPDTLTALESAFATPTPAPTVTPAPTSSALKKGDRGEAVKALQEKLIALGYLSGKADGIYGNDTMDAVRAFQRSKGLDDDGDAGPDTLAALNSTTVAPSNPSQPEPSAPETSKLLKRGSKGDAVKALQEKLIALGYLTGTADGKFGDDTVDAVKAFQRAQGLTADGIAGTSTLAALTDAYNSTQPSAPSGITLLKYGDTGDAVKALQTRLKELGYFSGTIGGNYGNLTRDAVKAFQTAVGLTNDGMAGEDTLIALYSEDAPEQSTTTLRVGDNGDAVAEMQTRLKSLGYLTGKADGKFGAATQSALMAFQAAAGLSPDGIAGPNTLTALYADNAPEAVIPSDPSQPDDAPVPTVADQIITTAKKYLGCKYVYACEDPPYFDCSGLTQYVFKQYGYSLLRTAYQQGYNDKYQKLTVSQLRKGDLVFFNTNTSDGDMCDHTGIYIGDGDFIHASSSAGKVIISNLNTGYYSQRFSWGRRILE